MNVKIEPYRSATAITPADTNLTTFPHALYIGTAGTLKVTTVNGDDVTFGNVTAGTLLNLHVKRVWSTGTSASNIVGLY